MIIDVAYPNGADKKFTEAFLNKFSFLDILSYSAWNTAGNSIGTAISHSSISLYNRNIESHKFLIERLLDDYLYQGDLRLDFVRKYNYPLNNKELEKLKNKFEIEAKNFIKKIDKYKINIEKINFPWDRSFEIDIKIILK